MSAADRAAANMCCPASAARWATRALAIILVTIVVTAVIGVSGTVTPGGRAIEYWSHNMKLRNGRARLLVASDGRLAVMTYATKYGGSQKDDTLATFSCYSINAGDSYQPRFEWNYTDPGVVPGDAPRADAAAIDTAAGIVFVRTVVKADHSTTVMSSASGDGVAAPYVLRMLHATNGSEIRQFRGTDSLFGTPLPYVGFAMSTDGNGRGRASLIVEVNRSVVVADVSPVDVVTPELTLNIRERLPMATGHTLKCDVALDARNRSDNSGLAALHAAEVMVDESGPTTFMFLPVCATGKMMDSTTGRRPLRLDNTTVLRNYTAVTGGGNGGVNAGVVYLNATTRDIRIENGVAPIVVYDPATLEASALIVPSVLELVCFDPVTGGRRWSVTALQVPSDEDQQQVHTTASASHTLRVLGNATTPVASADGTLVAVMTGIANDDDYYDYQAPFAAVGLHVATGKLAWSTDRHVCGSNSYYNGVKRVNGGPTLHALPQLARHDNTSDNAAPLHDIRSDRANYAILLCQGVVERLDLHDGTSQWRQVIDGSSPYRETVQFDLDSRLMFFRGAHQYSVADPAGVVAATALATGWTRNLIIDGDISEFSETRVGVVLPLRMGADDPAPPRLGAWRQRLGFTLSAPGWLHILFGDNSKPRLAAFNPTIVTVSIGLSTVSYCGEQAMQVWRDKTNQFNGSVGLYTLSPRGEIDDDYIRVLLVRDDGANATHSSPRIGALVQHRIDSFPLDPTTSPYLPSLDGTGYSNWAAMRYNATADAIILVDPSDWTRNFTYTRSACRVPTDDVCFTDTMGLYRYAFDASNSSLNISGTKTVDGIGCSSSSDQPRYLTTNPHMSAFTCSFGNVDYIGDAPFFKEYLDSGYPWDTWPRCNTVTALPEDYRCRSRKLFNISPPPPATPSPTHNTSLQSILISARKTAPTPAVGDSEVCGTSCWGNWGNGFFWHVATYPEYSALKGSYDEGLNDRYPTLFNDSAPARAFAAQHNGTEMSCLNPPPSWQCRVDYWYARKIAPPPGPKGNHSALPLPGLCSSFCAVSTFDGIASRWWAYANGIILTETAAVIPPELPAPNVSNTTQRAEYYFDDVENVFENAAIADEAITLKDVSGVTSCDLLATAPVQPGLYCSQERVSPEGAKATRDFANAQESWVLNVTNTSFSLTYVVSAPYQVFQIKDRMPMQFYPHYDGLVCGLGKILSGNESKWIPSRWRYHGTSSADTMTVSYVDPSDYRSAVSSFVINGPEGSQISPLVLSRVQSECAAVPPCDDVHRDYIATIVRGRAGTRHFAGTRSRVTTVIWEGDAMTAWGHGFLRTNHRFQLAQFSRSYPRLASCVQQGSTENCPQQCVPKTSFQQPRHGVSAANYETDCASTANATMLRALYARLVTGSTDGSTNMPSSCQDYRYEFDEVAAALLDARLFVHCDEHDRPTMYLVSEFGFYAYPVITGESAFAYFRVSMRCSDCSPYFTQHSVAQPVLFIVVSAIKTMLVMWAFYALETRFGSSVRRSAARLIARGQAKFLLANWQAKGAEGRVLEDQLMQHAVVDEMSPVELHAHLCDVTGRSDLPRDFADHYALNLSAFGQRVPVLPEDDGVHNGPHHHQQPAGDADDAAAAATVGGGEERSAPKMREFHPVVLALDRVLAAADWASAAMVREEPDSEEDEATRFSSAAQLLPGRQSSKSKRGLQPHHAVVDYGSSAATETPATSVVATDLISPIPHATTPTDVSGAEGSEAGAAAHPQLATAAAGPSTAAAAAAAAAAARPASLHNVAAVPTVAGGGGLNAVPETLDDATKAVRQLFDANPQWFRRVWLTSYFDGSRLLPLSVMNYVGLGYTLIFLMVVIAEAFVTHIHELRASPATGSRSGGWLMYQFIYFRLMNSAGTSALLVNCAARLLLAPRVSKGDRRAAFVAFLVLLPALASHVVPAMFIFAPLTVAIVGTLAVMHAVVYLFAWRRFAARFKFHNRGATVRFTFHRLRTLVSVPYPVGAFLRVFVLVAAELGVSMCYNLALIWLYRNGSTVGSQGAGYWEALELEWDARNIVCTMRTFAATWGALLQNLGAVAPVIFY